MRVLRSSSFTTVDLERWLVTEGQAHAFVVALDEADRGALLKLLRRAMGKDGGQAAAALADHFLADPSIFSEAIRNLARR